MSWEGNSMVEWKKLGDVCSFNRGKTITAKNAVKGEVPVIAGGQTPSYYHNQANREGESITVAGSGAYAGFVSYWDCPIFVSDAFTVDPSNMLLHKYVFQWLKMNQQKIFETQKGAGVPHVHGKDISSFLIPIPSLAEQERIVGILDTFTASIDNLKEQIELRRKQYTHYRDQLLDLEGKEGVEMKVSDFCLLKAGKGISASEIKDLKEDDSYSCFGGNGKRGYVTFYSHEGNFPIIGRQGALCGCVAWASGKFYATEHAVVASGKENTNQRFLFYLFQQANLNQYKSQGAQPGLSVAKLNELLFRIPPISEQERIVSILDTFTESISNLEAQLEQRQKQYEYYRNQLLTFA